MAGDGVDNLRGLSRETGLGTCCGKCVPQAREVLMQAVDSRPVKLSEMVAGALLPAGA